MADGNDQQYDTSQLDTVQHPILGPLKFPKDMPFEERNQHIDQMLSEQAASHKPPAGMESGAYQNRPRGPVLNINESPKKTAAKRFLGAIGGLEPTGEVSPTTLGTFENIPMSIGRSIASEWKQPTVGGPKGISTPLPEDQATTARILFPAHLAARGIEGIAGSAENASADVLQGIKRWDPRAIAAGTGEAIGTIGQIEGSEAGGEVLNRITPSRARIGLALRNEKGTLKPSVATIGRAGGTALGGYIGSHFGAPEGGAVAGALGGRALMDAIVPERPFDIPTKRGIGAPLPSSEEFYQRRAEDLTRRGKEQAALDRATAREAAAAAKEEETARQAVPISEGPTALEHEAIRAAQSAVARRNARQFVPVGESPNQPAEEQPIGGKIEIIGAQTQPMRFSGNEGTAARWSDDTVLDLASKGNRTAIEQIGRRGLDRKFAGDPRLENIRYIMGDIDYPRIVYNPREAGRFEPEPTAIRNLAHPARSTGATIEIPPGYEQEGPGIAGTPIQPPTDLGIEGGQPEAVTGPLTPQFKGGISSQGIEATSRPVSPEQTIRSLSNEIDTMKAKLRNAKGRPAAEKKALQKQISDYEDRLKELRGE